MNENFYHIALSNLKAGTTKDEFAANYANASNEPKGSDTWNSIFSEGQEIFSKYLDITNGNSLIDENEYNMFKYMLDFIKNLKPINKNNGSIEDRAPVEDKESYYKGNSKLSSDIILLSRSEEELDCADVLSGKDERFGLKPVGQMSIEEIKSEILMLNPNADVSTDDINNLKNLLSDYRSCIIDNDKNSKVIDYHVGTFRQNGQGSCGPLSQIAMLSDEKLRRIITECHDEKGTYYKVLLPIDANDESKAQIIRLEELESGLISLEYDGEQYSVGAFSEGDFDVKLLEFAYVKRFGYNALIGGETIISAEQIFAFPEENISKNFSFITEEKLEEAISGGHKSVGLKFWGSEPESKNGFTETFVSESGLTAKWILANNSRGAKEKQLKQFFPEIDESRYKNLNEQEFLEFIMLLEEPGFSIDKEKINQLSQKERIEYLKKSIGFNYNQQLQLSNGQIIEIAHAYTLKSYNKETKEVTIVNPWANNEDIVLPYDIFENFFVM